MLKKINDFLSGMTMTVIGGVFLLVSLILPKTGRPEMEYLAWVTVIISGLPLLYLAGLRLIQNKGISKISSALLISIAMVAAILIGDLFAAGEVAFIMALSALLEEMTTERAKKGLKNLNDMTPQSGRRLKDGVQETIPVDQVRENDILRILPGEAIPADGIIIEGETSVDQSIMTGESLPIDKKTGDKVFCGTLNCFGTMDIRVTKTGQESSLQKLIHLIQDAEEKQAPTQRIADRWASWLVPVALAIAIATYLVTADIIRAVTILVVFCPCALVLATPTAIIAAIGQATKHGVIIKSGEALEKMGRVRTIAFDKTGTLTYGKLTVSEVLPFNGMDEKQLLAIAASAEAKSEHPLAKAVTDYAQQQGIAIQDSSHFRMLAGKGVYAVIHDVPWYLGNERYIRETGIQVSRHVSETLESLQREGKATILVSNGKDIAGIITLSDMARANARETIMRLESMQVTTVLLTGDNPQTARYIASMTGITDIKANLLPEDKVSSIAALQETGEVCMIGDGVNDAPALKTADVGVAMGVMGSDIAVDAADIALMTDDISRLPYLKWLSDTTIKTIKTAIALSMGINFVAVILSVLGFLNPTTGALVHNAGSCFVVLLAALLYDRQYR
ncbi:MAG: cation-translocating P-type ATPase [Oxalobacter sp.]|nr:cation-translocating P-type ATPase [Oxalobacter sp.]